MARRGRDLAREAMGKRAEQSPPVSKALFFFRFKPMQNASERRICERAILSESVVFFCVLVPGIIYLQSLFIGQLSATKVLRDFRPTPHSHYRSYIPLIW